MSIENETWLLEAGDTVIAKKALSGLYSLSDVERALYALWVIDYSVRNSGTLGEVKELYPAALVELNQFAQANHCIELARISARKIEADEEVLVQQYHTLFDLACAEIQALYESR